MPLKINGLLGNLLQILKSNPLKSNLYLFTTENPSLFCFINRIFQLQAACSEPQWCNPKRIFHNLSSVIFLRKYFFHKLILKPVVFFSIFFIIYYTFRPLLICQIIISINFFFLLIILIYM